MIYTLAEYKLWLRRIPPPDGSINPLSALKLNALRRDVECAANTKFTVAPARRTGIALLKSL
ncbi:hypothetical protein KCP76_00165 [Salmonella enterica subsp. enterica serovar Weltevreden]|nr:hypothetical protein KCP76_00165 [Salmonella enterica subsp. enterica serovar Weltevreden]